MTTKHLLDPELQGITKLELDFDLTPDALPAARARRESLLKLTEPDGSVTRTEVQVRSADGTPVDCLLYQPTQASAGAPAYLQIHGGGYILGSTVGSDMMNLMICSKLKVVVLSVGYRLAPESNARAALDDCYAGLTYLHEQHDTLSIDPSRIAIGGESAGGGLAAALAIEARDRGEYAVCHQHLTYPMLDNLTGTEAQPGDPLTGEFVWTRELNQFGWGCYLGDLEPVAPYVPARLNDYSALPPTWMYTAALDLFRDENIEYAQKLMRAGVRCELAVEPAACHGFQLFARDPHWCQIHPGTSACTGRRVIRITLNLHIEITTCTSN